MIIDANLLKESFDKSKKGVIWKESIQRYEINLLRNIHYTKNELEKLADRFPDGVPLFYMYDEDNILNEHESPSDNPTKWQYMVEHNVYKLR